MSYLKEEQETIINYNSAEQIAIIYSRDPVVLRRLDALTAEFPETYMVKTRTDIDGTYTVPKKYISYGKPRHISEEQRERARSRIQKLNSRHVEMSRID